jgi:hypothetical protein
MVGGSYCVFRLSDLPTVVSTRLLLLSDVDVSRDPLPTPSPGQGRYYVTAVNYQGERRYGRRRMNGVLSGRDPAGLPGCAAR